MSHTQQLGNKNIMAVDPELACVIVGSIGQLWLDDQFVDLQIHVGDILFNCHQLILCACSKFFKDLLESKVKVEVEHQIRKVTIRGISPEIFRLILGSMCKGENGISPDNMIEFWHAAHQLQITFLVSKCETFVSSHLSQENFAIIYEIAVVMRSMMVIKATCQFVAENFESFKDSGILLQQPASFIEDIIGSDSLVGESQNHVVEFILKWVNYELCARETEHVCRGAAEHMSTESTVQNLSIQTRRSTLNQNGSVEVIFQKPLAASDNAAQPLGRKQSLGKLLKLVRFTEISKESLELLADDDLVMGCKETRDIVRQAMEPVKSAPSSAASTCTSTTPATSISATDSEDTVVFVKSDDPRYIYAYSLDRGSTHIYAHTNSFWYCGRCRIEPTDSLLLRMINFNLSTKLCRHAGEARSCCVILGDFRYTFSGGRMYKINKKAGDECQLFTAAEPMFNPRLLVFKDSILFCNPKYDAHGKQKVYCFNTLTRRHWHMMTSDYEGCDFVTFIHSDQLYILYGNGVFVNVTNSVTSPTDSFSLPKCSEISKSSLLWDFRFKIYGAVVHRDCLIVFGDFNSIVVSEMHDCQIPGLKTIKFIHLFGLYCNPLVQPKEMPTQRM